MSAQPAWPAGWPGFGWLVAAFCLVLTIVLAFMHLIDVPVAVLIAAICSHRL